jgi:hypothetical protein
VKTNDGGDKCGKKLTRGEIAAIDPELLEVMDEVDRELADGVFIFPPRTILECRDWWDGWLHFLSRSGLSPADYHWQADGRVKCVVLVGTLFDGRAVSLLESLAKRLGPDPDLIELRLVGAQLESKSIARLAVLMPNAKISIFSEADHASNRRLGYADPQRARLMIPDLESGDSIGV